MTLARDLARPQATGSVFADRHHARPLRTPLEVRRALPYVLHNHRHHAGVQCAGLDTLSSAPYFDGFSRRPRVRLAHDSPVAEPATWLLRIGWRRHGLLELIEVPNSGAHR